MTTTTTNGPAAADRPRSGLPPGPRGSAARQTLRLSRAPYEEMQEWRRTFGRMLTVRVLGFGACLWIADREAVREIFGDADGFRAGEANAYPMVPVVGPRSIFTIDGADHMRQRRLLLPGFHGDVIDRYAELFRLAVDNELGSWRPGETFKVHPRMRRITSEAIVRAVFGVGEAERRDRLRSLATAYVSTGAVTALGGWIRHDLGRLSPWGRFVRARARLEDALRAEIRERRGEPDRHDDVLSLLLQARHDDGSPATDQEILDDLMSLVIAGHETSATALAWAFDLVLHAPEVVARVRAEVDTGGHDYADAVVKESLRLRPPIAIATRVARRRAVVDGWVVEPGTRCWIPLSVIQRDAETFPDPDEFRPERFLGDRPAPFAWIPFGGGPRRCIGASFALLQMRVVLQRILSAAELRPESESLERERSHSVVVVPRGGVRVRLERLREASVPVGAAA